MGRGRRRYRSHDPAGHDSGQARPAPRDAVPTNTSPSTSPWRRHGKRTDSRTNATEWFSPTGQIGKRRGTLKGVSGDHLGREATPWTVCDGLATVGISVRRVACGAALRLYAVAPGGDHGGPRRRRGGRRLRGQGEVGDHARRRPNEVAGTSSWRSSSTARSMARGNVGEGVEGPRQAAPLDAVRIVGLGIGPPPWKGDAVRWQRQPAFHPAFAAVQGSFSPSPKKRLTSPFGPCRYGRVRPRSGVREAEVQREADSSLRSPAADWWDGGGDTGDQRAEDFHHKRRHSRRPRGGGLS